MDEPEAPRQEGRWDRYWRHIDETRSVARVKRDFAAWEAAAKDKPREIKPLVGKEFDRDRDR